MESWAYATENGGDYGWALAMLRLGMRVAREGWNGKGQYLELQTPDAHSKMTLPYIYICTVDGHKVPWLASQSDMLSRDWVVVLREKQEVKEVEACES